MSIGFHLVGRQTGWLYGQRIILYGGPPICPYIVFPIHWVWNFDIYLFNLLNLFRRAKELLLVMHMYYLLFLILVSLGQDRTGQDSGDYLFKTV